MTLTSLYTVFKGKSVNMMAIYNASKVNDRFRSLIQKGKLTDWCQIDLDISVKLISRLLLIYCQTLNDFKFLCIEFNHIY